MNAYHDNMGRVTRALQSGNPSSAIPILKQLIASNDRSYELHLNLGDAYLGTKRYRDALDEYTAARLLNPAIAAPVVSAARAHLAMGDADAALRDLADAAAIEPGTDEVLLVRGMVHEQQRNGQAALADYQAAVASNGSNAAARARLAAMALQLGRYDAAREQFETLLRMNYRPSRMHFGLGPIMLLDDQGHKQELTGAKDATLPAWSDDGAHMAWIERQDRRHLAVTIADVNAK